MINLRSLDLNLLTVFEAIYETGTVSGAGVRLALSKSATSHALSRLREACGDALFVRAGQGLAPTPIALALYPGIKQALEVLRASLTEAAGFDFDRDGFLCRKCQESGCQGLNCPLDRAGWPRRPSPNNLPTP